MKYSKVKANKIVKLYATGEHTITDICAELNIDRSTFYDWKATHSEFASAIEEAEKLHLDSIGDLAESSLIKLIKGTEFEEKKVEYGLGKDGKPVKTGETVTKKVILPNPSMVALALTNRKAKDWKNKQSIDLEANVNENITIRVGYGNNNEENEAGAEGAEV